MIPYLKQPDTLIIKPSTRTLYLVKRAETACRIGLETCLPSIGVTPSQYVSLSLLAAQEDKSSAALARRAGVSPQFMSEVIAALESKSLIVRSANPEWRRVLHIELTDAGRALLEQCDRMADELEARLVAGLSPEEVAVLRKALTRIARNGSRDE
jgi:DNA-binding MarR family transcriptional regulator